MVPKVVGSNPIFHPKFESLAFARLFSLYMAVGTCSHKAIYNEKVVVKTPSNFGSAPAASRWSSARICDVTI